MALWQLVIYVGKNFHLWVEKLSVLAIRYRVFHLAKHIRFVKIA